MGQSLAFWNEEEEGGEGEGEGEEGVVEEGEEGEVEGDDEGEEVDDDGFKNYEPFVPSNNVINNKEHNYALY